MITERLGADDEASVTQPDDPDKHRDGPNGGEPSVHRRVKRGVIEPGEAMHEMLDAHPGEGKKPPHDQRM